MKQALFFLSIGLLQALSAFGQKSTMADFEQAHINWQNLNLEQDETLGAGIDRTYREIIPSLTRTPDTVIVAVIDSGVDIDHEDMQGKIWINQGEIAGNGIDDDGNGYVDDIHGWNFLGLPSGENIHEENLEFTRIVRRNDPNDPLLASAKKELDSRLEEQQEMKKNLDRFILILDKAKVIIETKTGVVVTGLDDLKNVKSEDPQVKASKAFLKSRYESGFTEDQLQSIIEHTQNQLDFYLNLDFDPRLALGDDPRDISDRSYGNPDVKGPKPDHGSAVAGVIAANRGNGLGIEGIAQHVLIMPIRSTPDGDERDKDVALAIRYAVDNGAQVVNMSFGKAFSPEKHLVDEAVQYAQANGVLLIHAAGNDSKDIDEIPSYPMPALNGGGKASNWLTVGASTQKANRDIAATFSNYGGENVDIFAPGVDIVSTDSIDTYSKHDGTSLAAPVVSGVAAMVWSYYPAFSAEEIIDILMSTSTSVKKPRKVYQPSNEPKRPKSKWKNLSRSGIVNAYAAMKEAEKRYKEKDLANK